MSNGHAERIPYSRRKKDTSANQLVSFFILIFYDWRMSGLWLLLLAVQPLAKDVNKHPRQDIEE